MSGLSDPLQYKQYWGQYNGDFDNRREIETYDNLAAEYAGINGIPIQFFPINVDDYKNNLDAVLGESSAPKWDRRYDLTALLEDFTQETITFGDIGELNTDEITLYIHRSTFDKIVGERSLKSLVTTPDRRGAWGPVAKDMIMTPHNGLVYEVLTGGLHFLTGQAQHFGHKFWYKITGKIREVSEPSFGQGEQYGALPSPPLDPKYQGNPQFILPTPTIEEMQALGTPAQSGTPTINPGDPVCYTTTGTPAGPSDGSVPADIILPDGRVASQYEVTVPKDSTKAGGDEQNIEQIVAEVIDPQTSLITVSGSDAYNKYGPAGITIKHRRSLWGDW